MLYIEIIRLLTASWGLYFEAILTSNNCGHCKYKLILQLAIYKYRYSILLIFTITHRSRKAANICPRRYNMNNPHIIDSIVLRMITLYSIEEEQYDDCIWQNLQ